MHTMYRYPSAAADDHASDPVFNACNAQEDQKFTIR